MSRDAVAFALKQVVVDRMSIVQVAASLGVAWNTALDAIVAASSKVLIENAGRLEAVTTVMDPFHVVALAGNTPDRYHQHETLER